jgi:hypothetical protein
LGPFIFNGKAASVSGLFHSKVTCWHLSVMRGELVERRLLRGQRICRSSGPNFSFWTQSGTRSSKQGDEPVERFVDLYQGTGVPAEAKGDQTRCVWDEIKPSSLREKLVMSLRIIVSIAALVIMGIASVPTDTFARVPAGTTRLHHHKNTHHNTAQRGRSAGGQMGQVGR